MSGQFAKGAVVRLDGRRYAIVRELTGDCLRLEETDGEEIKDATRAELLAAYEAGRLTFPRDREDGPRAPDIAAWKPVIRAEAKRRLAYVRAVRRETDRYSKAGFRLIAQKVAKRTRDPSPPSPSTLRRWWRHALANGFDIWAMRPRTDERGRQKKRRLELEDVFIDQAIEEVYATGGRAYIKDVIARAVRLTADENDKRGDDQQLVIRSDRTIRRKIDKLPAYTKNVARYGRDRADVMHRTSGKGSGATRLLDRVEIDSTPSNLFVVDDRNENWLPMGRPDFTGMVEASIDYPMGMHVGFTPSSLQTALGCLRHGIKPKGYVAEAFPSVKNVWAGHGRPMVLGLDRAAWHKSKSMELSCTAIGIEKVDLGKPHVPTMRPHIERFHGIIQKDFFHNKPGSTFANILDRGDYDPAKDAVIPWSVLSELLHIWIIDVHLQVLHRRLKTTRAAAWEAAAKLHPPHLPERISDLDIYLGIRRTAQVWHYGIEHEGLLYQSDDLKYLRFQLGDRLKNVAVNVNPDDLGHIGVSDPRTNEFFRVRAEDYDYASGLSLYQHQLIRKFARADGAKRVDRVAVARAREKIREIVALAMNKKSTIESREQAARILKMDTIDGIAQRDDRLIVGPPQVKQLPAPASKDLVVWRAPSEIPVLSTTRRLPSRGQWGATTVTRKS